MEKELDQKKETEITNTAKKLSSLNDAANRLIASSVASILAETITLPTDVIKTRLQVQNISLVNTSSTLNKQVYSGMFDAMTKICHHEGIAGLFKGLQPALIRQVSYTGLAFIVFEPVRDTINKLTSTSARNKNKKPGFAVRVMSGGIAGAIGISVMNPTEVLKTKMQTNQSLYESPTMTNIIRNVYKNDGIFGFWAGVWPNICRAFLVNAAEIGMYDNVKNWIVNDYRLFNDGMMAHVSASFIAGVCSAIISTPVDVVKTRFMNQAGINQKEYKQGMLKSLILIPQQEGFSACYKGFTPIVIRKVAWCTLFFVTYERVRRFLSLPAKDK